MGQFDDIEAILFDFLGTLVCFERLTVEEGISSVIESLKKDGCPLSYDTFYPIYKESVDKHWNSRRGHEETYNKYWIADALKALGIGADPDGAMITRAVEAYFEPFHSVMKPLPGAVETLKALKGNYRVGLVSNFTYSPTVIRALEELGMRLYIESIVISADLGLRKPSPIIFRQAMADLGLKEPGKVVFIGDDVDADIIGAIGVGMVPILISYTLKDDYQARLSQALNALGDGQVKEVREIKYPLELLEILNSQKDGGNHLPRENVCQTMENAGNGKDWWEQVQYVIDEYWDSKFGFNFGIIDWRSLGCGC